MFLVHGVYHFRPRVRAFRRDYCRRCEGETISVRVRTVDVLHVFWVPLVPLGVFSRWSCRRCGQHPHRAARTRLVFKIALVLVVAFFGLVFWLAPHEELTGISELELLLLRVGLFVALAASIWWAFAHRPEPAMKLRLAAVAPHAGSTCPLCDGQLLYVSGRGHCTACLAEHDPLAPS
jgi:hypothetical protein